MTSRSSGRMTRWGRVDVPIIERDWVAGLNLPYRKTYDLKPGQKWTEAEVSPRQREKYVLQDDGTQIPVGAMICYDLMSEGAEWSIWTEMWGGVVLMNGALDCVEARPEVATLLEEITSMNSGKLRGLPDVIARFEDGRLAFRDAKCIASKDRLGPAQHAVADLLRDILGTRADLAVVQWGREFVKDL